MDSSVWFESVDTALISFIRSIVSIDDNPVKVKVRKPDDDFNHEDYPLISIYNLYDIFSRQRYDPEPQVLSRDTIRNCITLEESSLPYDLYYQIDFWSTSQSDMNSMVKQWKSATRFWFNLDVFDASGNSRSCFVLSRNDFNKSDLLSDGMRLFHSFGTYRVSVEIDEGSSSSFPMVTTPVISISPKL